ncbi:hypothetical protein MNBD_NITROSPIRAE01-1538 [hydrothermal vent metagenome]|uniref:Uncharacterized protein n=1 Tax=hydrothermal vent metagenome TaxID=652676 RepID=A0A3B1D340_9ZZZZ
MGSYKVTADAQADLDRIWRRGLKEWNEVRQIDITMPFLTVLNYLRNNLIRIQLLTISARAIEKVCVVLILFTIALLVIRSKL